MPTALKRKNTPHWGQLGDCCPLLIFFPTPALPMEKHVFTAFSLFEINHLNSFFLLTTHSAVVIARSRNSLCVCAAKKDSKTLVKKSFVNKLDLKRNRSCFQAVFLCPKKSELKDFFSWEAEKSEAEGFFVNKREVSFFHYIFNS